MSITDSFDPVGKPLITPADSYRKSPYALDVCVINFSQKIMDALIGADHIGARRGDKLCLFLP